tara:strand:+ start:17687 stop:17899 length:213 start_codon:yes stop_codon:yes gene_type:complete
MANIRIYAELSRSQYGLIQNGSASIVVPYGTTMHNKRGSRGLSFECDDNEIADELVQGLQTSGINWQRQR